MRYAVVIEQTATGYSAYAPDLPGCIATGASLDELRATLCDAIAFHLDGLRDDGAPVPPPSSVEQLRTSETGSALIDLATSSIVQYEPMGALPCAR
jgi:predicted RNase H-like HicB family nuclease